MDTNTAQPYTDEQWYTMCDLHIGQPVPLHEADLTRPFVYYRPWGVMWVPSGRHQVAMATLFAFHHGHLNCIAAAEAMGVPNYRACETLADRFLLELDGTAFLSSVAQSPITGQRLTAGAPERLDSRERMAFRTFSIHYIGED